MKSINPYDLSLVNEYEAETVEEVNSKINLAQETFLSYRNTSFESREKRMLAMARILQNNIKHYALMLTTEMGKPIREAVAEIKKCAWVCEYYAENAEFFLRREKINTDAKSSYVTYEPLGIILGVMPWNFPFWQVFRFSVPTVMAGNTVLLKHASNVQSSALLIEKIFYESGFPKGVFQNLMIESDKVENVLKNPKVKGASVTGSETAGASIASICGSEVKKTVLELGGSNAFIVLKDAPIKKAAKLGVRARMINNGQSCIAAKRFILLSEIANEFMNLFEKEIKKLKVGNPTEENIDLGPLARVDLAEKLEDQLKQSINAGATLRYGGERRGAFFTPTIISNVKPGMPAFDEELFGPVAAMITANSKTEAIEFANKSSFGLGATIVSRDIEKAIRIAEQIEDGAVFINEVVKSDPRLPFGGTKRSGYGRELSNLGIKEFVNAKTVYIN